MVCGASLGDAYCQANPNSTGEAGELVAVGSDEIAVGDLTLLAAASAARPVRLLRHLPRSRTSSRTSRAATATSASARPSGFLDQIDTASPAGTLRLDVDLSAIATANGPVGQPGDTWNFQAWHRDLNPSATSNLTQGLQITLR